MSLFEAIVSAGIIFIAGMVIISAASKSTTVETVDVPEVPIVWQQRLVHNAINNPYIDLVPITSDKEGKEVTNPDSELIEEAGSVPYIPTDEEITVSTSTSAFTEEYVEPETITDVDSVVSDTTSDTEPVEEVPVDTDLPVESVEPVESVDENTSSETLASTDSSESVTE